MPRLQGFFGAWFSRGSVFGPLSKVVPLGFGDPVRIVEGPYLEPLKGNLEGYNLRSRSLTPLRFGGGSGLVLSVPLRPV